MLIVIVTAVIVGLVWGTLWLTRGSLMAGCLLVLLLMCCCGFYLFNFDVAGITLTLDRIAMVALMAAFMVQWRLGRVEIKPLELVDWLLLSFVALLVASTFTHDWHASGAQDIHIVQHLMNGYLIPLALYFIARQSPLNERNVTMILAAGVLFGVYLALTGVLEAMGQWSLVVPRYIARPEVGLHFGRARGPMVHAVSYGLYLSTCLLCLWLWRQRLPRFGQLVLMLIMPLFGAAIFFTKTRSVWLGAAAGLLVVLCCTLRGRVRLAVVASALAACVVVGMAKKDVILAFKRGDSASTTLQSASMRKSFAYVSWLMFQDRPVLGFGFGQFPTAKLPYLSDRSSSLQLEAIRDYSHHNTFLSLLTETGLVGLGLLLAVLAGWTSCALRLVRCARFPPWARRHGALLLGVLGIAFWQMMFHEITYTSLDNSLIFMIAGVAVGLEASRRSVVRPVSMAPIGAPCSIVQ